MKPKPAVSIVVWLIICVIALGATIAGVQTMAGPLHLQQRVAAFGR